MLDFDVLMLFISFFYSNLFMYGRMTCWDIKRHALKVKKKKNPISRD